MLATPPSVTRRGFLHFGIGSLGSLALVRKAPADDEETGDARGAILKITLAREEKKKGTLGTLVLDCTAEKNFRFKRLTVIVTKQTKVEKVSGKDRKAAAFEELKPGTRVQVVYIGRVEESTPVMAQELLILEPKIR